VSESATLMSCSRLTNKNFMKITLIFCFALAVFFSNCNFSQVAQADTLNKVSYKINAHSNVISETDLTRYKIAINSISDLDEFRFLNERRMIFFEKNLISVELYSASELYEKYGKEIAPSTIIPGSKYYPVTFQIIPWENNYIVNLIYEKNNIQTH
jgi:hypothetical protein